jgi:hypothetical protein
MRELCEIKPNSTATGDGGGMFVGTILLMIFVAASQIELRLPRSEKKTFSGLVTAMARPATSSTHPPSQRQPYPG